MTIKVFTDFFFALLPLFLSLPPLLLPFCLETDKYTGFKWNKRFFTAFYFTRYSNGPRDGRILRKNPYSFADPTKLSVYSERAKRWKCIWLNRLHRCFLNNLSTLRMQRKRNRVKKNVGKLICSRRTFFFALVRYHGRSFIIASMDELRIFGQHLPQFSNLDGGYAIVHRTYTHSLCFSLSSVWHLSTRTRNM